MNDEKIDVKLTKEQLSLLLAVIDCSTNDHEPDHFYDCNSDTIIDDQGNHMSTQKFINDYLTDDKVGKFIGRI